MYCKLWLYVCLSNYVEFIWQIDGGSSSKPAPSGGFTFGGTPGAGGFTFTKTTTPAKPQSEAVDLSAKATPKTPQSPEGDYYVNTEEDDSHIYFEPIVQLPESVRN